MLKGGNPKSLKLKNVLFKDIPKFKQEIILSNNSEEKEEIINENSKKTPDEEVNIEEKTKEGKENEEILDKINTTLEKINERMNKRLNELNKDMGSQVITRLNDNITKTEQDLYKIEIKSNEIEKRISKKDMCKLIIEHYVYRINLISTILSIIDKDNDDYNNLCYSNYKSLENGEFLYSKN